MHESLRVGSTRRSWRQNARFTTCSGCSRSRTSITRRGGTRSQTSRSMKSSRPCRTRPPIRSLKLSPTATIGIRPLHGSIAPDPARWGHEYDPVLVHHAQVARRSPLATVPLESGACGLIARADKEHEADQFATDLLIPPDRFEHFSASVTCARVVNAYHLYNNSRIEVNKLWLLAATGVDFLAILFRPRP